MRRYGSRLVQKTWFSLTQPLRQVLLLPNSCILSNIYTSSAILDSALSQEIVGVGSRHVAISPILIRFPYRLSRSRLKIRLVSDSQHFLWVSICANHTNYQNSTGEKKLTISSCQRRMEVMSCSGVR